MTTGIYGIVHVVSGRVYVGQSQNIEKRWINHRTTLNRRRHHSVHLQRCWNKYGADAFEFKILEVCDVEKLSAVEAQHMARIGKKLLMNTSEDTEVPFRGRHHTEETKKILSERHHGKTASPETRQKMGEAQRRRYSTEEGRQARSDAAKRGYQKPGALEKHRERQKRILGTDEFKRKNSEAQKKSYQEHPERAEGARTRMKQRFSTEEARIAVSRKRGGRPVIGTNISTGKKKRYEYLEAVLRDGFDPRNVKKVLLGRARHHKWWLWKYEE